MKINPPQTATFFEKLIGCPWNRGVLAASQNE